MVDAAKRNSSDWSVAPLPYDALSCGEVIAGTAAAQLPTVACSLARLKMRHTNAGTVYLGGGSAVSIPNGTADATTGVPWLAGEDTGWLPISNLNKLWSIASADAQSITYWTVT